jgi:hypothetical protein
MNNIKISAYGQIFETSLDVANKIGFLRDMIEVYSSDNGNDSNDSNNIDEDSNIYPIVISPINQEDGSTDIPIIIMNKIIEFCSLLQKEKEGKCDNINELKNTFIKNIEDKKILINLVLASNFLDIPELLDLTTFKIANDISYMSSEELISKYNIK